MTLFKTLKILSFATLIASIGFFTGCSESTSPNDQATVQMAAELDQSGVGAMALQKGIETSAAGAEVDSLYITRVRLLVSDLKMHANGSDSTFGGTIKTGPFLIQFDSAGSHVFTSASVPAGNYDRIKFEIHKLSSNEVAQYLNDPVFQDFVTDDRWTVIVDGYVVANNVRSPFTYRSKVTENIQVRFEPDLVLEQGSTTMVALEFAPRAVFKKGSNRPLDPRDGENHNEIEKSIKDALHALKK